MLHPSPALCWRKYPPEPGVHFLLQETSDASDQRLLSELIQLLAYRDTALKGVTRWHRKAGVVTHVFTHFPLELVIYTASVPARTKAPKGMRWVRIATLADEALPNVMRKAIAHGLGE